MSGDELSEPRVDIAACAADWPVVERLWQLYAHDLSEFRGTLPGVYGTFGLGRLPSYRDDSRRQGYLVRSDGRPAGFALVKPHDDGGTALGEFFVVRAARRGGLGSALAEHALHATPGPWRIAFQEANRGAARFWRTLVGRISCTPVREEHLAVPGKPELPYDTWLHFTV